METLIITIIFIVLFIATPWVLKKYLKLKISVFQWALISCSGVCTFIAAGIFMGEPLPPFPEWGIQIPYWSISLLSFIVFSASIYLILKLHVALKYGCLALGYPIIIFIGNVITRFIYDSSV